MYKRTFIFGYGFFLSAVAGTLLGLFYVAQNFLIDYFWQGSFFQPLRNAIVITFIALVIIFFHVNFFWTTTTKLQQRNG